MPSSFPSPAMASSSSTSENPRLSDHLALATAPISGRVAVTACAAMAFFYVAILYSPTLILRLLPPASLESFMIRRFACAVVSSMVSVISCFFLLGVSRLSLPLLLQPRSINANLTPILLLAWETRRFSNCSGCFWDQVRPLGKLSSCGACRGSMGVKFPNDGSGLCSGKLRSFLSY
ncbi:hypothetical protein B296_00026201 [Ensete ventricosum]|uniref:Uncharacterized protein n=1 Tax=Ensete ventricosum TaxID=4639 RepID=A0A427AS14_ENSVE|nr:hypothetical protein B296_00026201 [Ensete ventricosum]